jgi:hypothetical protein
MVRINNQDVMNKLAKNANIQIAQERAPNELAEKIVPTFETNPQLLKENIILGSTNKTSTGAGTIFTTDAQRETYITSIKYSYVKSATCDVATGAVATLTCVIDGVSKSLLSLVGLTLTAEKDTVVLNFTYPLKIDKNSIVAFGSESFTAGTLMRYCSILGYVI